MSIGDFVSFMSGNTTRASVALIQGDALKGCFSSEGWSASYSGTPRE
nr:hypothetical protein [Sinorhizobium meliloti]